MGTKLMLAGGLVLATVLSVHGQTFGEISGQVRDSTGAAIPAVQVTATNVATNVGRTAITNDAGLYTFPAMVPGVYSLKAEKTGFKATVKSGVEIQVQQSARIDFDLQVGQLNESVEVSAAAQLLSTEDATVGTVIDNRRIVELPLNGRNYLQLVSLAPNVSYGFGTAGQADGRQGGDRASQNISVGGGRSEFNYFTLDGVDNTDPNFNTYVIQPSIDAVQEFKVQTGIYPAEFGHEATQINVSTKPGTNNFHGTLYEFLRNDALDAANYSFTAVRNTKYPFKWNQYGGTLGGPGLDSEAMERQEQAVLHGQLRIVPPAAKLPGPVRSAVRRDARTATSRNYSARALSFTTPPLACRGRTVRSLRRPIRAISFPPNQISSYSKKFLEFYPIPNLPTATLTRDYQQSQSGPRNKDIFVLRMDFAESAKSQWFGRYSWDDENQLNEGLKLNGSKILTNVEQYMGSNIRIFSPTLVNEFRFGDVAILQLVGTRTGVRSRRGVGTRNTRVE